MDEVRRVTPEIVPNLRDAIRRARLDDAERAAAIADLRGAELVRLEILRDALSPLFAQLPEGAELFDHGLVPGEHPRLFVDILSFVEMAEDKRRYRFMQDGRWGQRVMAEADDIQVIVKAVTDYVALRLVEREKALSSDTVQGRLAVRGTPSEPAGKPLAEPPRPDIAHHVAHPAPEPAAPRAGRASRGGLDAVAWFACGAIVGALALLVIGLLRARGYVSF
jgi:hypothetical protein